MTQPTNTQPSPSPSIPSPLADLTSLSRAELTELAQDLAVEVGQEVKASAKSVTAALAMLPDGGAGFLARRTLSALTPADDSAPATASSASDEAAEVVADAEPSAEVKMPIQQTQGFKDGELDEALLVLHTPTKQASKAPPKRWSHLPDATPCIQLVSGPNAALESLGLRRGDILVGPSKETARLFGRGAQSSRLTLAEARERVAQGDGRFNARNSAPEAD